jgi:hypothetical protein
LFVGRRSLLNFAGLHLQSGCIVPASPFEFVRIPLKLLGPTAIERVLSETKVSRKSGEAVNEKFGFNDSESFSIARLLYQRLNGHPRSLLTVLQNCQSKLDLEEFEELYNTTEELAILKKKAVVFRTALWELLGKMDSDQSINFFS